MSSLKRIKSLINFGILTEDKNMPELHLKQPGFTQSTCGPFTKHYERIQKFRETGNLKHLYRNELDMSGFAPVQHLLTVKIQQQELF